MSDEDRLDRRDASRAVEPTDRYLDLASSKFQEAAGLTASTDIELLGSPSDRAAELTRAFGGRIIGKLAGFGR